jgi:uncharacterized protein YqgC (DUF456 family)
MLDYILLLLSIVIIIVGLAGCILPVIPGPPISFVGILVAHFTKFADFSVNTLFFLGALAVIVQILDYIVPVWGTKKFGGSKAGVWGSVIGLIVGIILLPMMGIILGPFGILGILGGPFFGALVGEIIAGKESEKAFIAAFGSFIGFIAGTLMKLTTSIIITVYLFKEIWQTIFG